MEIFDDIKKYKNIHSGESAILIGSGPSLLKNKDNFKFAKNNNFLFFGNNDAIFEKELFELDYFFLSDPNNLKRRGKDNFLNATVKKKKFFVSFNGIPRLNKSDLKKANGETFLTKGNSIFNNLCPKLIAKSSIFITIQMMAYMGIKKIYLAGCDCQGGNVFINKHEKYKYLVENWVNIKSYLKDNFPDLEIYSLNPVGLKDIFPEDDKLDKEQEQVEKDDKQEQVDKEYPKASPPDEQDEEDEQLVEDKDEKDKEQ